MLFVPTIHVIFVKTNVPNEKITVDFFCVKGVVKLSCLLY